MKRVTGWGVCLFLIMVCCCSCQGEFLGKTSAESRDHQSVPASGKAAGAQDAISTQSAQTAAADSPDSRPIPASQTDPEKAELKLDYGRIQSRTDVILDPLSDAQAAHSSGKGRPLQIGIGRELPPPYSTGLQLGSLKWTKLANGGQAAAIGVTSSGAGSIRIALARSRITEGIELRFFGNSNTGKVYGPYRFSDLTRAWNQGKAEGVNQVSEESLFWSPVVDGQTIGIEICLPARLNPQGLSLVMPVLSHLYR